ncbi:MAG: hypothetical protein Q8K32_31435 [Archangium sp.]|nr:hypothetical protein [Archangium sp.]
MNAITDMFPEAVVPKVDENRRYTTRTFMHFIKRVTGVEDHGFPFAFDLDPAADLESHHAGLWFCAPGDLVSAAAGAAVDGLAQSWLPAMDQDLARFLGAHRYVWRIFVNPPFDNIGPWLSKVWATIEQARGLGIEVRIAFVMPGNRTEQPLWQDHVEPFLEGHERARWLGYKLVAHSPRTRQFYGHPGNVNPASGQAEWPSVVLVWRRE